MTVGERIKELRTERGWSQKTLGEKCDPIMDAAYIRRIESGKSSPTANTMKRLALALEVRLVDLFDFDEIEKENMLTPDMADSLCEYIAHKKKYEYKSYFDIDLCDMIYRIITKDRIILISSTDYFEHFFGKVINYAEYEFDRLLELINNNSEEICNSSVMSKNMGSITESNKAQVISKDGK